MKPEPVRPFTLSDLCKQLIGLTKRMLYGCGNRDCVIRPNRHGRFGGCLCSPKQVADDLQVLALAVERVGAAWPGIGNCDVCELRSNITEDGRGGYCAAFESIDGSSCTAWRVDVSAAGYED